MTVLQKVLVGKAAFTKPANIIGDIPLELAVVRPHGLPHSLYEELWHLDYWLRFSSALIRGENPTLPAHSAEGFPADQSTLSQEAWDALVARVSAGLEALAALANDEAELARHFRPDITVHDELTVVATHNAYHLGRMVALRQLLGIWSPERGDSW